MQVGAKWRPNSRFVISDQIYNLWHHRNGTTTLNWNNAHSVWKGRIWLASRRTCWSRFAITNKSLCHNQEHGILQVRVGQIIICLKGWRTRAITIKAACIYPCIFFLLFHRRNALSDTKRHYGATKRILKNISCLFLQLALSTKGSGRPIINQGSISHSCAAPWPFFYSPPLPVSIFRTLL